jgi:hypothetical protein
MTNDKSVLFANRVPNRFTEISDLSLSYGFSLRTMPIAIGGTPKRELIEQVKSARSVSPSAEEIIKQDAFTTLEKHEAAVQIILKGSDFGFGTIFEASDILKAEPLERWSRANLDLWEIALNPPEAGLQLAIEYTDQPRNEVIWVPTEGTPTGRRCLFKIERNDNDVFSLDSVWVGPALRLPSEAIFAFRLRQKKTRVES